ncbi:MAG: outer membrane protein assembly factor BamA [Puniceicoccales bacterium]|nr:outer membrane protein assembly factor BamA [Puniceicoccales bacterium]
MWSSEAIVRSVDVQIRGDSPMNREAVFSHIKLKPGCAFKQELNDASIHSIYETQLFDYVEVTTKDDENKEQVDVLYVLHSKPRIGKLLFIGNENISAKKLRHAIKGKERQPLNFALAENDRIAIEQFYCKRGYVDAAVVYRVDADENLVYLIDEGKRSPIARISFEGNAGIGERELRGVIQTRRRTVRSILNGSGYCVPQTMKADVVKLKNYYKSHGFLDVEIDENSIRRIPSADGKSVQLIVPVREGERFSVGNVEIVGNSLYGDGELRRRIPFNRGDWFSPEKVDAAEESIRYFYGQSGYMETHVTTQRHANVKDNSIDITFAVHESEKCKVGLIQIQGNAKTKNSVILRELSISPGSTFDLIKMRNSENRLRETRYFTNVVLTPELNPTPNFRDVLVSVEEANTGKFYLGGAFSSRDNIIGYVEFSQSNFDVGNRKMRFQGAGQKFRMRFETGTRSQQAVIAFEEPWLFQRELAFGTNFYQTRTEYKKTDHNYSGDSYNERHGGFDCYLRKRIIELLEGRIYYTLEQVEIYDVHPNASLQLHLEALKGAQWISKVGINLQRDTRDSLLYPTVGNKVIAGVDYAGLGGDVHYLNLDLQMGQWMRVAKDPLQTLGFLAKFGSMKPYRQNYVPYFDRKFLGGVQDMRGFELRAVGPRDLSGSPNGANSYAYGCAEYSYKLTNVCRFIVFAEGAYMGSRFMNLENVFYGDCGVEVRLFIMGSPLRLIFGYPLCGAEPYPHKLQFNFTFGTTF